MDDLPDLWRKRFGRHSEFIPIEDDDDLRSVASLKAAELFNVHVAWYTKLGDLAAMLDDQAARLEAFRSNAVEPGSSRSIAEIQQAASLAAGALKSTVLYGADPSGDPMLTLRLLNHAALTRQLADHVRNVIEVRPPYLRERQNRGVAADLGLGRATYRIAEKVRLYRGDGTTSYALVAKALRWYGHDLSATSRATVAKTLRQRAARYAHAVGHVSV